MSRALRRRACAATIDNMDEPMHPVQLEALRRATPAQKLATVAALYEAGIRLRVAGLRMTHPDWSDEQLDFEARRSLRHAGT
jgi:Rv0078B-related antitoxin